LRDLIDARSAADNSAQIHHGAARFVGALRAEGDSGP
jgi:hypothetical protein